MTKNIIIKVFSVLLLTVIMSSVFFTYDVKAVTINKGKIYSHEIISDLNVINQSTVVNEEKIMKYDAKTGTTVEVDMEQISSLLRNANINELEAYENFTNESNFYNVPSVVAERSGLTQVTNTTNMPYRATCRITCSEGVGTGFLVGPNLLLTAAHCVMEAGPETKFANWTCYPAYNNGEVALNGSTHSTGWAQIYYSNNWVNSQANDYDWCLCVLEDDLGLDIGAYFGLVSYNSNSSLNNVAVRAIGYAGDAPHDSRSQWTSTGNVYSVYDRHFLCNAKTEHGMSGGPIVRTSDNKIVGLVKGGVDGQAITYGVRITQNILDLISSLR